MFKLFLLILIISSISCKSVNKRNDKELAENEVEDLKLEKPKMEDQDLKKKDTEKENNQGETEKYVEKTTEAGLINQTEETKLKNETHKDLDPTASTGPMESGDSARAQRNLPRPREVEPSVLIENFRQKLKTAHNNLQETIAARRASEPKLFILDPNTDKMKPLIPTIRTFSSQQPSISNIQTIKEQSLSTDAKKIITSPTSDDSSSSEEDSQQPKQIKIPTKNEDKLRNTSQSPPIPDNEDITHLLHVRAEINKLRHMMQTLREQQLRQQFGAQIPLNRNLTEEETRELSTQIEKLKNEGKISIESQKKDEKTDSSFQQDTPETAQIHKDIKKLKESVLTFASHVRGENADTIEELEKQIHQQREEINDLKKLVDNLHPPKQFPTNPAILKHPQRVKSDLHQQLKSLQEILDELIKKEEVKAPVEKSRVAQQQPDEEIGTLMHILRSLPRPGDNVRVSSTADKLKLLDKMEKEIDGLKSSKKSSEKPITPIKKVESRGMELNDNIEKELDNLQKEIDILTKKSLEKVKLKGDPMSSRQLESLFSDILSPPDEDSSSSATFDLLTGKVKKPAKIIEVSKDVHSKLKEHEILPPKTVYPPPVFQLPFCLQKFYAPQYQPYPPPNPPVLPLSLEKTEYQPINIQTKPAGYEGYHGQPAKAQNYEQNYQQPQIKVEQHPIIYSNHQQGKQLNQASNYGQYSKPAVPTQDYNKPQPQPQQLPQTQSYDSGYQQPIKIEQEQKQKQLIPPVNYKQYATKQPAKAQSNTNEYQQPIKIELPQLDYKQPEQQPQKQTNKPSNYEQYNQQPMKAQSNTNHYEEPIKTEPEQLNYNQQEQQQQTNQQSEYTPQPIRPQGYNQQPIKNENKQLNNNNKPGAPIKTQTEAFDYNKGQSAVQKYTDTTTKIELPPNKPIIHHIYHPKATPVKIEYRPHSQIEENDDGFPYSPEEMQYKPIAHQYKPSYHHTTDITAEIDRLNGMINNLDEKMEYVENLEPNYGPYRSQNFKPRQKRSPETYYDKKALFKDIKQRLANLRSSVENVQNTQALPNISDNEIDQRSANSPDYYQQDDNKESYGLKLKRRQKFDDLFIKIVKFILHKLEISAPYVVDSLFNGESYEYDAGYTYKSSKNSRSTTEENLFNEENDIQKPFGGLLSNFQGFNGLLGFIPMVLFKLLSNFSSFLNILKRNNFFKNFLFPGALILAVDGIMAILIWWFSSDENHNLLTYENSNYVSQ